MEDTIIALLGIAVGAVFVWVLKFFDGSGKTSVQGGRRPHHPPSRPKKGKKPSDPSKARQGFALRKNQEKEGKKVEGKKDVVPVVPEPLAPGFLKRNWRDVVMSLLGVAILVILYILLTGDRSSPPSTTGTSPAIIVSPSSEPPVKVDPSPSFAQGECPQYGGACAWWLYSFEYPVFVESHQPVPGVEEELKRYSVSPSRDTLILIGSLLNRQMSWRAGLPDGDTKVVFSGGSCSGISHAADTVTVGLLEGQILAAASQIKGEVDRAIKGENIKASGCRFRLGNSLATVADVADVAIFLFSMGKKPLPSSHGFLQFGTRFRSDVISETLVRVIEFDYPDDFLGPVGDRCSQKMRNLFMRQLTIGFPPRQYGVEWPESDFERIRRMGGCSGGGIQGIEVASIP